MDVDAGGNLEVGYDVPARPGMAEDEIETPCLVVDLDAMEANIARMQGFADEMGVRLRVHGKTHKCPEVARRQVEAGAVGICCQKVSEAEAFVRAGIGDVLVSNEVRGARKVDRLARLAGQARIIVCVDDAENVPELQVAAARHGTTIECLVEIDCGAGRCGVAPGRPAVAVARAIDAAENLRFAGLQAYHGPAQHKRDRDERKLLIEQATRRTAETVRLLEAEGLSCAIVGGAGTGTFPFEGRSGVYNELQCGSYVFMDADYGRNHDERGETVSQFRNALFVLTSVMSHAKPDRAICDAGLKSQSFDSGLPVVFGRDDVAYVGRSDEHGDIADPDGALRIGDRLRLVPGHVDPTCNTHDWIVALRGGRVEAVWPVAARGKLW